MAGESVIGALRIVLGMDTASLEEGTKRATRDINSFARQVEAVFAGTGLVRLVERGFDAIAHQIKSTAVEAVKFADEMGKMAQKVGVPVEELSALRVAAELSDVSMEQLGKSLGFLSRNMIEAANGTGKAQEAFRSLGIDVRKSDGSLKSSSEVLGEVAGKFETLSDGAAKTAAAMALFGRSGRELIPLLNEGREDLEKWRKVAENMGLVVLPETAAQADHFGDNLQLLGLAKQGVANIVTRALLPALIRLSDQFVESAKSGESVQAVSQKIIDVTKEVVVIFYQLMVADELLGKAFIALQDTATSFGEALGNIIFSNAKALVFFFRGEFAMAMEAAKSAFSTEFFNKAAENFRRVGEATSQWTPRMDEARQKAEGLFKAIDVEGKKAKQTFDGFGESKLSQELDKLALQTRVLRGDFDALAPGFAEAAARLKLTDEAAKGLSMTMAGLTPAQQQLNQAMLEFSAEKLISEVKPAWQAHEEQLARINLLYQTTGLTAAQAALASRKSAEATGQAWDLAADKIVGDLSKGLKAFAEQNKDLAVAAKAAAIAQAIINTYTAATKALATYPPPLSYIAAGAAVVAGLGYVAQIRAQSFQLGGSFKVPGGVSGVDTTMIPLQLAAGEQVDITPASEARRGAGGVQEIVLTGIRPRDMFTGDMLRDLFESLNQGMADGYKLKVAT